MFYGCKNTLLGVNYLKRGFFIKAIVERLIGVFLEGGNTPFCSIESSKNTPFLSKKYVNSSLANHFRHLA